MSLAINEVAPTPRLITYEDPSDDEVRKQRQEMEKKERFSSIVRPDTLMDNPRFRKDGRQEQERELN